MKNEKEIGEKYQEYSGKFGIILKKDFYFEFSFSVFHFHVQRLKFSR